jgi:hypothetical protein
MESAGRWGLDRLSRFGVLGDPDMPPTLLRVLTELYVQRPTHTVDEERHYTELALRLLDAADIGTRAAVARRLTQYASPPRRVLERLAGDISVGNGQRHPFWSADLTMLNHEFAGPAAIASEIAITLNELFFAANSDERRLMLLNLDVIAPFAVERRKLARENNLSGRLEAAVLFRNREAFAQHLAQALHISRRQARRVVDDDLGEPTVVAAKALNIRRGALYRTLLFPNVGRSLACIQALTELHHELPAQTAEHMVAIWRSLPGLDSPAERYQPMLWADSSATRPRTESAVAHNAVLTLPEKREAS